MSTADDDGTGATGAGKPCAQAESVCSARLRLAALEQDREQIEARKRQLWTRIVEIRAQSVAAGEIRGPLTRSDRRMRELAERRARRLDEIHELLDSRERRAAARETELQALEYAAGAARTRSRRARAQLETRRANDAEYQRLAAAERDERQAQDELQQRLADARRERDDKIARYEHDALFVYLYDRGYRTARYRARGPIRGIDRWIASLVAYDQARQDYELLQEMPRWLEENIRRQSQRAVEAAQALQGYVADESDAREAGTFEHRAQAAENRLRDRRTAARAAAEADARLEDQLAAFRQRRDPESLAALALYGQAFHGQPAAVLMKLAEQTTSRDDDQAVRELAQLNDRGVRLDGRIEQLTAILEDESSELERRRESE